MDSSSIPVVWWDGRSGFWDHGMLLQYLRGDLYGAPRRYEFTHILDKEEAYRWSDGGVLVVPGPLTDFHDAIRDTVARMPWAVVQFMSDEEIRFPYDTVESGLRKIHWLQNPWPGRYDRIPRSRRWCTGTRSETRDILRFLRNLGTPRDLMWSFCGQATHANRFACVESLRTLTDLPHELEVTGGFGQGRDYASFLKLLLRSRIVPCPSGNFIADSFRMAEALEAGALPIVDARGPAGPTELYWPALWSPMPVPTIHTWTDLPALLRSYAANPVILQQDTNRAVAWWIGRKRETALTLTSDIWLASDIAPQDVSSRSTQVTVLMPTSPIPSHPSTQVIEESVARIRAYPALAAAEIFILIDGVRPEQEGRLPDYEEYKRRLIELCNHDPRFRGCLPVVFDQHKHQASMTRAALKLVRTPFVFFVEHDTFPMGEIPFDEILTVMARDTSRVPVVRFHIFEEVLEPHRPLYESEREDVDGVPFIRTRQWSQRPHLAATWWYERLLSEHFSPNDCTMIEDCVHGPIQEAPWDHYRVRIYAPPGSLLRSATTDGREGDPKYAMYYRGAWR